MTNALQTLVYLKNKTGYYYLVSIDTITLTDASVVNLQVK